MVYFLSGADMVKIGFTRDLSVRMNHLSNNSPVALVLLGTIEGGVQKEIEIQLQFSHIRSHGEWYRATPELLNFIEELTQ